MTPTLLGRWHTRTFLLLVIGGFFTLLYWLLLWQGGVIATDDYTLFVVLITVTVLGYLWDIVYNRLTLLRWDQDWPPIFQLFAGIWEYLVVWLLLTLHLIPWTVAVPGTTWIFHSHYWLVWVTTFVASQGFLRILDPRWRFRGGQLGTYRSS